MTYDLDCLYRLLRGLPSPMFDNIRYAERWLKQQAETGSDLASVLAQYPAVRYEPLDCFYVLLQGLGALPRALPHLVDVGDYVRRFAALLLVLEPDVPADDFLAINDWSLTTQWWQERIRVARGQSAARVPADDSLDTLRKLLSECPRPQVRLTPARTGADMAQLYLAVKEAYRSGGADAALDALRRARP